MYKGAAQGRAETADGRAAGEGGRISQAAMNNWAADVQ
jgi:hypothetical protein